MHVDEPPIPAHGLQLHLGSGPHAEPRWINVDKSWMAAVSQMGLAMRVLARLGVLNQQQAETRWPRQILRRNLGARMGERQRSERSTPRIWSSTLIALRLAGSSKNAGACSSPAGCCVSYYPTSRRSSSTTRGPRLPATRARLTSSWNCCTSFRGTWTHHRCGGWRCCSFTARIAGCTTQTRCRPCSERLDSAGSESARFAPERAPASKLSRRERAISILQLVLRGGLQGLRSRSTNERAAGSGSWAKPRRR
jgi:hypothetical protein